MKKIQILLLVGILVVGGFGAFATADKKNYDIIKIEEESIIISDPVIIDAGQYVTVNVKESTTSILEPGKPVLPVVTQVFTFPFETKIISVDITISDIKELILQKEVQPAPKPIPINAGIKVSNKATKDTTIYDNSGLYPTSDYNYITASGLKKDEHVLYLLVRWYPIRYSPLENKIYNSKKADIKITYKEPSSPRTFDDIYDLVIIAPSEFSEELQPLIDHKNNHEIKTILKTTQAIYSEYEGWDEAEEIKYFIKDAIENWGTEYILLIGSIDKLPIRISYATDWEDNLLSDLYYADIYNDTGSFCSWDENNNGKFGEVYYYHHQVYNIDGVDLYPDVIIGRLACSNTNDVNVVVDKIIHYETNTYGKSWFKNIIFCGGDTFPFHNGNEGEEINLLVEQIMSDFIPTKLWTSTNTFNSLRLNLAVNKGAGFIDYSGHGYADGLGTHPPNSNNWKTYYTKNLAGLFNGYKHPIIFFDACLTAKLDYNEPKTNSYYPKTIIKTLNLFLVKYNTLAVPGDHGSNNIQYESREDPKLTPCFAWNWVKKTNGGAIATIGASRVAYTGTESGAGKLSMEFFSAYKNSETLGQMMTQAQNEYITDVPYDFLTIEEFILLGDPTLKIGGYTTTVKSR